MSKKSIGLNYVPDTIRNLLAHQLSQEKLKNNLSKLSPAERKQLEEIKGELNLITDEDTISFLRLALSGRPSDRKLLSPSIMLELDKLTKISYKEYVRQFKNKCENSTEELYTLVTDTLHSLWVEKYQKEEAFRRFEIYKNFERILFKDPRYRDHFIHQFQVFLTGLPILEQFYDNIRDTYSKKLNAASINIDFTWLLAATFHDIGYLVQQFDEWLKSFFKEFLEIENLPFNVSLDRLFLERNFQDYIDKLTSLFLCYYDSTTSNWKYDSLHPMNHDFRKMLTNKFINERNHGIVSSLILLDRIENSIVARDDNDYKNTVFSSVVMPAGLSIALHDNAVFLNEKVHPIDFKKDPLTFILIYCDTIQEWGRPITPVITDDVEYCPILSKYSVSKLKVSATIAYKKIKKLPGCNNKTTFDIKDEDVKKTLSKLKSDRPCFEISLQSIDSEYNIPERTYKSLS